MSRSRPTSSWRVARWLFLYVAIAGTPLVLAAAELRPGRGFVINLSVAMGFVALAVLGLQFTLTTRATRLTTPFGVEAVLRYHRQLTLLALATAYGHPALLFLAVDRYRVLLDVVHDPLRAQLAWAAVAALGLLIITSAWRRVLRLSYRAWHVLHTTLAVVAVLTGAAHAFLIDYYLAWTPMQALWLLYAAVFVWVAVWLRLIKPLRLWQRPWRVVELWPEPGSSLTVGLEPAFRHTGERFEFHAGQFAWIFTGRTALAPSHPFSMSSPATRDRLEFTIKDAGGEFTSALRELRIGDEVYVDGPHGTFTLERHPAPGYVFLAAGVGVTPFLSMLATLADRMDSRPCWLFLGNRTESQIVGIRQLARLAGRLNLTTIHALSQPGPEWLGERGRIDARLLARNLPANYRELHYFVCARDEVVRALMNTLRALDVPARQIHAELFEMV